MDAVLVSMQRIVHYLPLMDTILSTLIFLFSLSMSEISWAIAFEVSTVKKKTSWF